MTVQTATAMRIQELCRERKITVNMLATLAGMPRSSVKSILYGASKNPGILTIKLICDACDITLEEFFHSAYFKEIDEE